MMIKKRGEAGSALSLVLIFVTIAGLAIAALIFVTQISTSGVHQLSESNKNSSAVAAATADILARFQKNQTLGTATYAGTTDNCGLGQNFALDANLGVSFVSCVPVTGGAPFATTTTGVTVPGGTVGVDYGTAFDGTFQFDNALNSATKIVSINGKVTTPSAQENLQTGSDGSSKGTTPGSVTITNPGTVTAPVSACAVYANNCKLDISYWVDPHGTSTPRLPVWSCPASNGAITLKLAPGEYNKDDISALNRLTNPSESSKYKGWLWKDGKYEDGAECSTSGRKVTLIFSDGEFVFKGNTTLTINNSNLTVRNLNTKVKMCTTGYLSSPCGDVNAADNVSTPSHTGVKQYSCDYDAADTSAWTGPLSGPTTDPNFRGSRIFLDTVDLNVLKGSVFLCGSNFSTTKVLNNYAIIAMDTQRVATCKSHEKVSTRCPSAAPARDIYINFANTAEVHIGGGIYSPNAIVSISESRNHQHTWDREWTSKSLRMTCSYPSGCEHSVTRSEEGRTVKITMKDKDGHYISREININDYDPTTVIKRNDN